MIPHLSRTVAGVQSLALAALPHGGQRSARRNAWASMSADAARARARRDAEAAVAGAVARSTRQAARAH